MHRLPIILLLFVSSAVSVAADDIRVMSFNIRYGLARDGENHWDKRKDFVAETIAQFDPDLLGTQETLGFQKDFLTSKLPGYTSVGVGREDGGDQGEMTAIFFKTERFEKLDEGHFWLSETPDLEGSVSWDSSLPRMASWVRLKDRLGHADRPILFLNTHFDHKGKVARQQSAELIRSMAGDIGDECEIVLTGDFNAPVRASPTKHSLVLQEAALRGWTRRDRRGSRTLTDRRRRSMLLAKPLFRGSVAGSWKGLALTGSPCLAIGRYCQRRLTVRPATVVPRRITTR